MSNTTAQKIALAVKNAAAVTLYGGYAVDYAGGRVTFEAGRIVEEKRNKLGRCTRLVSLYADGSKLVFTWSENSGAKYRAV